MNRFFRNISLFFHSLFFGMKGGDKEILLTKTQGLEPDYHSEQEVETGTVYQDLLREQETQKVKEVRDATYRVFREADNYLVTGDFSDERTEFNPRVVKKDVSWFNAPKCNIAKMENENIYLIQDQKEYDLDLPNKAEEYFTGSNIEPERVITCNYDGFTPKFNAGKYLKKVVVFDIAPMMKRVELYFPAYAGQFTKTDAIFLKRLKECLNGEINKFDSIEISSIEFITNKAFGKEDLFMYKFGNLCLKEIYEFDGNIVVSYTGFEEISGLDLTEKFFTKEMDEKYNKKEQKSNTINIEGLI